jgi:hypothetical protein
MVKGVVMKRMDSDQMRLAMIEITNDRTEGSKLKKAFPEQYQIFIDEINAIKKKGRLVEIPPEVP